MPVNKDFEVFQMNKDEDAAQKYENIKEMGKSIPNLCQHCDCVVR